jgi:hypothetical protein
MSYDRVEAAIRSTLEAVAADWNAGNRFDWTREVATRLCQLAQSFECKACARGRPPGAEYGEWLYDICWYVEDEVCLTHLPLVGECEWAPEWSCDGDFQKLLQARADHRLWIFGAASATEADDMIKHCRENVGRFRASERGDRYLFACRVWAELPSFRFDLYVHQQQ